MSYTYRSGYTGQWSNGSNVLTKTIINTVVQLNPNEFGYTYNGGLQVIILSLSITTQE
mgnify:CR=1 FL=1